MLKTEHIQALCDVKRIMQEDRDACAVDGAKVFWQERVDAIEAALILAGQCCGNCRHWTPVDRRGLSVGVCENPEQPTCDDWLESEDGCRLGWEAKS